MLIGRGGCHAALWPFCGSHAIRSGVRVDGSGIVSAGCCPAWVEAAGWCPASSPLPSMKQWRGIPWPVAAFPVSDGGLLGVEAVTLPCGRSVVPMPSVRAFAWMGRASCRRDAARHGWRRRDGVRPHHHFQREAVATAIFAIALPFECCSFSI